MTLEQLMAAKGYTAQEISDLAPLLSNAKFRSDVEAELTNADKAKADLDEYDRWFTQEITPEHQALLKRTADAEANAAAEKARFEAYQKSGMIKLAGADAVKKAADDAEAAAVAARKASGGGDVDTSKYVTADVFGAAYEKTGDAIAKAINITTQHMQLFPGQYMDMEQLRAEAKAAKKPIEDYWKSKYNVDGKKAELAAAARQKEIDEAVKKREVELMAQFGGSNPNIQVGVPSNNPFVIKRQTSETKQPWEKSPNDVSRDRVQDAIKKAAARGELVRA